MNILNSFVIYIYNSVYTQLEKYNSISQEILSRQNNSSSPYLSTCYHILFYKYNTHNIPKRIIIMQFTLYTFIHLHAILNCLYSYWKFPAFL